MQRPVIQISIVLFVLLIQSCTTVRLQKDEAHGYIKDLQEGLLLVRLKTSNNKIDLLKNAGREQEAQEIAIEQQDRNQRIMQAFGEYFDFCPVYFFHAPHSGKIRTGSFIPYLLDADASPVLDTSLQSKAFLFAEFGLTQANSGNSGLPALILMDKNFSQLTEPFPFSVRTSLLGTNEMENRAVQILNNNLHDFLIRSNFRQKKQEIKRAKKQLRDQL